MTMRHALDLAREAMAMGEVPVGAVVVQRVRLSRRRSTSGKHYTTPRPTLNGSH